VAIALINTIGQLGGIVSPVMVGRMRDLTGSATPALYVIAAMRLLCAVILFAGLPASLTRKDRLDETQN
jgi:nitrate/nitrite transporter NarK